MIFFSLFAVSASDGTYVHAFVQIALRIEKKKTKKKRKRVVLIGKWLFNAYGRRAHAHKAWTIRSCLFLIKTFFPSRLGAFQYTVHFIIVLSIKWIYCWCFSHFVFSFSPPFSFPLCFNGTDLSPAHTTSGRVHVRFAFIEPMTSTNSIGFHAAIVPIVWASWRITSNACSDVSQTKQWVAKGEVSRRWTKRKHMFSCLIYEYNPILYFRLFSYFPIADPPVHPHCFRHGKRFCRKSKPIRLRRMTLRRPCPVR